MGNSRQAFERSLLLERIASYFAEKISRASDRASLIERVALTFESEGAKQRYLDNHDPRPGTQLKVEKKDNAAPASAEGKPDTRKQKREERAKKDKEEDEKYWAKAKPEMQKLLKNHGFDPEDVEKVSEQNPEWLRNRMRELREDGSSPRLEEYGLKKLKHKK